MALRRDRDEATLTFGQRLFESRGVLGEDGMIADWTPPREILAADGAIYRRADQAEGEIGKIKAFRDPEFFRDPRGSGDFLTFTGSSGNPRRVRRAGRTCPAARRRNCGVARPAGRCNRL